MTIDEFKFLCNGLWELMERSGRADPIDTRQSVLYLDFPTPEPGLRARLYMRIATEAEAAKIKEAEKRQLQ